MNRVERWFLRRIIRAEVKQSPVHRRNIIGLYREIYDAAKREFYEDNVYTRNAHLTEWFEQSLDEGSIPNKNKGSSS